MRIAIYSRKSLETDTGESIKNQIKFCMEYFQRQNENCTFEIFEDEGFSGGNINRPGFQRMMELVKIKQFDVVAVYKIDRIARNIVDFVNIYDELEKLNVKLVSVTEGFDPSTPIGKMMMLLLASFAEMERMNIAQRVKDNMKELAKLGRWSGGTPPTGYTTEKVIENGKKVTYLKLITEESQYIEEIFKKYADGYTTYKISNEMKKKGFNYPSKTIINILNNPTYLKSTKESIKYLQSQGYTVYGEPNGCGFLPYNRRPRVKGKKLWNDKSKFVGISKHEAIIDLELFMKVQERLQENAIAPRPKESSYTWLAGLVKCRCGSGMFVQPGRQKKDGSRVAYFRCTSKKSNPNSSCNNKFLRVDRAEKIVLEYLSQFLDKNYFNQLIKQKNNNIQLEKEINALNKKINSNTTAINNLVDKLMFLSNEASFVVTKKIEELTSQNNKLKEELLILERRKILNSFDEANSEAFYKIIINFINCVDDIELRRFYIKNIIKFMVWDSDTDTLTVELNI